jgi:hypothetical protein
MTATWFYMKRRWLGGTKKMGPLSEHDLLLRIDNGEITPETLLCSEKTKNHWVKMDQVGPALERWQARHPVANAN